MTIVHHLDDSRSQRILWLLEELGVAYEIRQHKRNPNFGANRSHASGEWVKGGGSDRVAEESGITPTPDAHRRLLRLLPLACQPSPLRHMLPSAFGTLE
jgi:hypothetical protein